ncbi:duf556 family protein [Caballeronia glathei]|jgi:uncharacterized protein (UPF0264 family)|uniref:(5-formylfuran-3-yl)methyl phosphate synthase n=1 Tax=Caballeronia glathei TaxID=60547 RepID=A0A069PYH5_9BURK|nr:MULTISPECIES: (5-formylfuran-3-yl)methyl phosphate synthase [Burkholderiaceae]KDR42461.1 hypothetical protein BG61_08945 [Caballeronia glathei]TCK34361.1 uncharacterized protein (UPF0264 family) [Paraburkholderia sp. BL8N3]CDY78616.1 duf556 family protein [Caballeronia glathei]
MIRLLISVRDLDEAREAAAAGAALIDLKEPRAGALGALPAARVESIVRELRAVHPGVPVSATIGDLPPGNHAAIEHHAGLIGRCGVDYVKAGVPPGPHAFETLRRMRALRSNMVPVLLADDGLDLSVVEYACALGFTAIMADTARKKSGNLFHCVSLAVLDRMVQIARAHEVMAGLAGALRLPDLPRLRALRPDFAGFRTAVCPAARTGRLDPANVRELRALLCGASLPVAQGTAA